METSIPKATGTVLVVEDEPIQRMMIVDLVEEAGLEAVEAMDAEDAIRILEARPDIRIVFADIDMPNGFDGMVLAASIRDRWPPIELILISARRNLPLHEIPARGVFFHQAVQGGQGRRGDGGLRTMKGSRQA